MRFGSTRVRAIFAGGIAALVCMLAPALASAQRTVLVTNSDSPAEGLTAFDASAGPLDLVAGTPIATGDEPTGVTFSPDARFAYVANFFDDSISVYSVGLNGVPVPSGTEPTGDGPTGLTFTPDGQFLLGTNRSTPTVSVFSVDAADGSLTPVAGSPFNVGIFDPRAVAVAPDGDFAYVSGRRGPDGPPPTNADRAIAAVSIGANGALTPIAGSPYFGGNTENIFDMAITPDGARLFVMAIQTNTVQAYNLNATTGALTAVGGSPFPAGTTPLVAAVTPDGKRLYTGESGTGEAVRGFTIGASGTLTPLASGPFALGADAQGLALSATGTDLYTSLATDPGTVAGLRISASGSLAARAGSPYGTGGVFPNFFSVDASPVQTPDVAFTSDPAPSGELTSFDAEGTVVRGGNASRFDWDFGDGSSALNIGATAVHTYADPGTYQVKLTVRNDCDPDAVFESGVASAGNAVYCNGNPQRTLTKQVEILPPDTTVDGTATAKKKQKQKGKKVVVIAKVKAGEELDATGKGKVEVGKKSYGLKKAAKTVPAGKTKKLKLKPKKDSAKQEILDALDKGKKAKAKLTVTMVDGAGNSKATKLQVKLKR